MAARDKLASELTIRAYRPDDRDAVVDIWERCGSIVWYNDPDRDIALWCASPNAEIFVGETKPEAARSEFWPRSASATMATAATLTTSPSIRISKAGAWAGA